MNRREALQLLTILPEVVHIRHAELRPDTVIMVEWCPLSVELWETLTINEARGRLNLPALHLADEQA